MCVRIECNKAFAQALAQTNNLAVGRNVVRFCGGFAALEGPARSAFIGQFAIRAVASSKDQRIVVLVDKLARRTVFGKACARQIRDAAELNHGIPCRARNARGTVALRFADRIVAREREIAHVKYAARVDNAHGSTELTGIRSRRGVSLARNRHAVEHNGDRLRPGKRTIANIANIADNTACIGQPARKVKLDCAPILICVFLIWILLDHKGAQSVIVALFRREHFAHKAAVAAAATS